MLNVIYTIVLVPFGILSIAFIGVAVLFIVAVVAISKVLGMPMIIYNILVAYDVDRERKLMFPERYDAKGNRK
jgi:hypothetical protein